MSFKNSSTAQVALIYGRFPSFTSSKYLTLNNDTISGISFEPNKPFLWILEQNGSSVIFF